MNRYSRQREAIKEYLLSTDKHPTAEVIYKELKKDYPNLSLGTVYRNLNFLCDQGDIQKIECGDKLEHFDGNSEPHNHLYCRNCNTLVDLEMESINHIKTIAAANYKGKIEGYVITFYGVCEECMKKINEN